jgi:hypothetical protein
MPDLQVGNYPIAASPKAHGEPNSHRHTRDRKRKLKCDEGKPRCRRCIGSGRACEGYRHLLGKHNNNQLPEEGLLLAGPTPPLFASAAERRSFSYFHSHACRLLAGPFHASFWRREVLQAAIHYPAVRHLVIALGAAYEGFEGGGCGVQGQEEQFALRQCNHAIRLLAAQTPSAEATCCVLTASLLFVYLASVRGHFAEAFQHVRSAVKVLQGFEEGERVKGAVYPVPVSRLRSLLASVYGQLRAMVNDTFLDTGSRDILVSECKPAVLFTSVQDAHSYVEGLFHNSLAFLQASDGPGARQDPERIDAAVARHRELCQALESSENALAVLGQRLRETDSDTGAQDQEGLVILRVYHMLLSIWLRIDVFRPGERESAYDDAEGLLGEMLRLCESVVERPGHQADESPRSCSSGLGCVLPLHVVAARCRNPQVRRRAVQLLLGCSRREGLWDAQLTGKVASQTIEVEEQAVGRFLGGGEDGLVREVKLELRGEKSAVVRFITVGDWRDGNVGRQSTIRW